MVVLNVYTVLLALLRILPIEASRTLVPVLFAVSSVVVLVVLTVEQSNQK